MKKFHDHFENLLCQRFGSTCCFALFLSLTTWVAACQVPVFRYALERWMTDKYAILVIHDGPINESDHEHIDRLKKTAGQMTNVTIRSVDIRQSVDSEIKELWNKHVNSSTSIMAILYPQGALEVPNRLMHVCSLEDNSTRWLFQSPLRSEMAKRLETGQSAVWIFVPSGHQEKDVPALQTLNQELLRCQQELTLPALDELELLDAVTKEKAGQMRIEFSAITLARDDSQEQFLVKMLLASEDDLASCNEPLAFPIFGRGRVLYALVGKGINDRMIHQACQFVVGPCSCKVKAQNPGVDLLMNFDWEQAVGDVMLSDPLPDTSLEPVLLKIPSGQKAK